MADQPNILFISTDQQFAGAMSCAGNENLSTPGMDRIAANGTRFERAYCPHPLCCPARASYMSGKMPHEAGVESNGMPFHQDLIPQSIGNVMRSAGYKAALAGKWHVPGVSPEDLGLDVLCPMNDALVPEVSADYFNNGDKPFFLFASFINPHDICQVARNQDLPQGPVPSATLEDCPGLPENFAIPPYAPEALQMLRQRSPRIYPTLEWTDDDWRHFRHAYYRLCEKVDAEVVRLLDALDASGKADNTVVIFTSDHGDGHGAHHWNQKTALWEEEIRIPMLVSAPGGQSGQVSHRLVSNGLDLLPTACDYAGVACPDGLEGLSLRQIVEGSESTDWREELFVETQINFADGPGGPSYARTMVTDQYKYSVYLMGQNREQLVDLQEDPGEMVNLAVESRHRDTLLDCRDRLRAWGERTEDPGVKVVPTQG
ncbi:MAG: sulfatase [Gemmatimonadetes bacterium]|nr:sulfatase [Gemmatimonadota bacterium]